MVFFFPGDRLVFPHHACAHSLQSQTQSPQYGHVCFFTVAHTFCLPPVQSMQALRSPRKGRRACKRLQTIPKAATNINANKSNEQDVEQLPETANAYTYTQHTKHTYALGHRHSLDQTEGQTHGWTCLSLSSNNLNGQTTTGPTALESELGHIY